MKLRNLVSILFGALLVWSAPALASNVSDHWYVPGESGWGVGVTQQEEVAFIAMYVYGSNGQPMWLTGEARRYGADMEGNPGFAGPLYRTTGPHYGGPFDPAAVTAVQVGTITFEAHGVDDAFLQYTVDGLQVTKSVKRFTFRTRDWTGLYRGVVRANYRDCAAAFTPAFVYDDGLIDVEQQGETFRMWVEGKKAACMYTGKYRQQGRMGQVSGDYTCADGPSGTFTLTGLETNQRAFAGRITASHPSCSVMWEDVAGFVLD